MSVFALFMFAAACDHAPPPAATPDAGSGPFAGSNAQYSAGPFTVQPGTSIVMCTFVQGTNTEDVDVQGFVATQSVGGHHLIVYTVDHAIDLPPMPCLQGGQPSWTQVVGTQAAEQIVAFPANVGFHVKANQQFVMETHYINATPNVMTVQSAFALWYSPAGTVTLQAHPYFFGTLNIDIPANAVWSAQSTCAPPDPVTFYAMQGHEHQMGTGVTVDLIPGDGGLPAGLDAGLEDGAAFLYSTTIWDSPPYVLFGNGAGMPIGPADQIHVTCDWDNTGNAALSYPQEMCFAVGFYWPGPGALFCLQGGGDNSTCNCGYQGTLDTGPGGSTITANVSLAPGLTGTLGAPPSSGHPIYCDLYRAQDWPPSASAPDAGAQFYYAGDVEGVVLTDPTVTAPVTFFDVTPGDYSVFCFEDTIAGGYLVGTGDPVSAPLGSVTAVAGQTTPVAVQLSQPAP
jgi:hypothetical protein